MQESSWPANCPDTLYDICLEYCALHLDNTVCQKSTEGQLVLRSDVFLPPYVCDALLSRLYPIGRRYLPVFASPATVNFRHVDLKSVNDLTDVELQHVLAHRPTDLRISSEQLTEDSINLISSESHNLQTLHLVNCENIFCEKSRSKKHSWKNKFQKCPAKRANRFHCPKVRYIALRGVQLNAGESVCHILSVLTLLTRLDLSDSNIDVQHLHAALARLQKLQILSLHNVALEPTLQDAAEAVAQLKSLRFVSYSKFSSALMLSSFNINAVKFACISCHHQHNITVVMFVIVLASNIALPSYKINKLVYGRIVKQW